MGRVENEGQTRYAALTKKDDIIQVENYNNKAQHLYSELIDSSTIAGLISAGNTDTTFYWSQKDSLLQFTKNFLQSTSSFISEVLFEIDTTEISNQNINSEWKHYNPDVQFHSIQSQNNSYLFLNNSLLAYRQNQSKLNFNSLSIKVSYNNFRYKYFV